MKIDIAFKIHLDQKYSMKGHVLNQSEAANAPLLSLTLLGD